MPNWRDEHHASVGLNIEFNLCNNALASKSNSKQHLNNKQQLLGSTQMQLQKMPHICALHRLTKPKALHNRPPQCGTASAQRCHWARSEVVLTQTSNPQLRPTGVNLSPEESPATSSRSAHLRLANTTESTVTAASGCHSVTATTSLPHS
jgi:hypothetical protein